MPEIESRDDEVSLKLTRVEAAALAVVAEWGLRAVETFKLVDNPHTAERALVKLKGAVTAAERVKPRRR